MEFPDKQGALTCLGAGVREPGPSTRRAALLGTAALGIAAAAFPTPALAKTVTLEVKDLSTKLCANPQAAGVPGSSTYKVHPPSCVHSPAYAAVRSVS